MGCTWNRHDLSQEEQSILHEETILGYGRHQSVYIDMILRKHSHLAKLNKKQFNQAANHLKLKVCEFERHTKICDFYSSFQHLQDYDLKMMLVLGILHGQGKLEDKAKLLFEIYDVNGNEETDKKHLYDMLIDMSTVAIDKVAILVVDNPGCSEYKVKQYLSHCNSVKIKNIDKVISQILVGRTSISKSKFVDKMMVIEKGQLLSTHGLRKFLYEDYSSNPPNVPPKFGKEHLFRPVALEKLQTKIEEEEEPSDAESSH